MPFRPPSDAVRRLLLGLVYTREPNLVASAVAATGLTRQAIHGRLARLVADGTLNATGRTRGRKYTLASRLLVRREYANQDLQEDRIWNGDVSRHFAELPANVRGIWHYGCAGMLNNAIEHSGSDTVNIEVSRTALFRQVVIIDHGIGIFHKIRTALGLPDERDAVIELLKGKVTTDPERHSGHGIFFTSRMFGRCLIASRGLIYSHGYADLESIPEDFDAPPTGTAVLLELADEVEWSAEDVYDKYSSSDQVDAFLATEFPIRKLEETGADLVSRSQARRLTTRLEKFSRIELDFSGVEEIGQAFADEIFRVFARAHPGITIIHRNAPRRVLQMIRRAQTAG